MKSLIKGLSTLLIQRQEHFTAPPSPPKRPTARRPHVPSSPEPHPRGELVPEWEAYPHPVFFVSVAAKGLSQAVSLLFATLAARSISVASKGVMGAKCRRESNGLGWEDVIALHGKPHNRVGASKAKLGTENRGWAGE